jgi:hypothetical protein
MKWIRFLRRGFIEVAGTRYDLTHKHGPTFELAIGATSRYPALTLRIEVEFTSHCVSFSPKENEILAVAVQVQG